VLPIYSFDSTGVEDCRKAPSTTPFDWFDLAAANAAMLLNMLSYAL
jgi:hypothetical protein